MKLKKLFKTVKDCKKYRKDHYIKWDVHCFVDDRDYCFSLIPTVLYEPWPFRYNGFCVIDIWWFNWHITIGTWKNKEDRNENL